MVIIVTQKIYAEETRLNKEKILEILNRSSTAKKTSKQTFKPKENKVIFSTIKKGEKQERHKEIFSNTPSNNGNLHSGIILPKAKEFKPSKEYYKNLFANLPKGQLPSVTNESERERVERLRERFEGRNYSEEKKKRAVKIKTIKIERKIDPLKELY